MEHGASPADRSSDDGTSILKLAFMKASPVSIQLLISKGALAVTPDSDKAWCLLTSDMNLRDLLFSVGVNPNANLVKGKTVPILTAGHDQAIALLDHGADPKMRDDEGLDAFDWMTRCANGAPGLLCRAICVLCFITSAQRATYYKIAQRFCGQPTKCPFCCHTKLCSNKNGRIII